MTAEAKCGQVAPPRVRREHLPADIFGLSALSRTALAGGMDFGPIPLVRRPADLERPVERHDPAEREALAMALERGLESVGIPDRVKTSLNVLATGDVFCVVTGQQPGFLSAPLYSLYKAMQACKLAHELSLSWGLPVVPVFWNHADDHDIAEVHHAWLLNRNLDLSKSALAGLSSGRQPLSRIVLDEEHQRLGPLRASLTDMFEELPCIEAALDLFLPRPGETLPRALTRSLTELLGAHGLVVVEPDWIRNVMASHLAHIVGIGPRAELEAGSKTLVEAGFEAGIDPATAALVYRVDESGRSALRSGGEGFRFDDEPGSRTAAELAAEIIDDPASFSPGALLRPLVQDGVFPTCAYIGGWGELAYHAQLGALRDACDLPRTPFVPRVSATLVDGDTRASLDRLELDLREVLGNPAVLETQGEGATDSPPVVAKLRETAERAARDLAEHKAELSELDPSLGVNLKKTAQQIRGLVEKIVGKAERVHANSKGKGKRHVRRLSGVLVPRGLPQERVLGPMPFMARYGMGWVDALYEEWPALSSEHLAIHLEETEDERERDAGARE